MRKILMKLKNLLQLIQTRESTLEFLRENELIARKAKCKKCRSLMKICNVPASTTKDEEIFRCSKNKCKTARSIRYKSFFSKSNLPLDSILLFIHLWCKNYPAEIIHSDFDFAIQTITDWSRFCRDLCVESFIYRSSEKIGGVGSIVEIDESLLVKRKYNRGRMTSQQWIFGGIERRDDGEKRFFIEFVEERSEAVLIPIILRRIELGTKIISDGWKAYSNIGQLGYSHEVIIHDENFVDPTNEEIHTQNVENMWLVLKRFLRKHGTHRSPHEFEYVTEFFFRWKNPDIFDSFLSLVKAKYSFN